MNTERPPHGAGVLCWRTATTQENTHLDTPLFLSLLQLGLAVVLVVAVLGAIDFANDALGEAKRLRSKGRRPAPFPVHLLAVRLLAILALLAAIAFASPP
jgi:hypothetical protein